MNFRMKISISACRADAKAIEAWWRTLPASLQAEWLAIEQASFAGLVTVGISKDWIEEHGGDRRWWRSMLALDEETDILAPEIDRR